MVSNSDFTNVASEGMNWADLDNGTELGNDASCRAERTDVSLPLIYARLVSITIFGLQRDGSFL